jgi:hypothetical protein
MLKGQMKDYLHSDPHFFRLVKIAMALGLLALLVLAAFIPAPLEGPADIGRVPNPVKSAWFLMWIQELVSHSNLLVYPGMAVGLALLLLPWLPCSPPAHAARWLPREQWPASLLVLATFAVIVAMTIIALFFRGENWRLVWPF